MIGRYKLRETLGEGGCGVVYVAEQEEPVRRRVALKVIKLGMDTKAVVARFEAERQALAIVDHPNIAKVLDAGTTDAGRPYFVMELVRGITITDYCDDHRLATQDRLELFIKVCHAIQHAHQKGIIHRDIKPSNILVTLHDGVPVPKVIDFGIAKATEGRLTNATVYTQLNNLGRARRLLDRHRPAPGEEDLRGWEWRYLWQQCQSDALAVLAQRPARGFSVSFSPDGQLLAAGYFDGRVELWDVARRVLRKVLYSEAGNPPAQVAFSPRKNVLAATGGRGVIKLYDLAADSESILWQSPGRAIRDLYTSHDSTRLVAFVFGAGAPAALVIDPTENRVLSTNTTSGAAFHIGIARLSADRRRMFLSRGDNQTRQMTILCRDHETGEEIWKADVGLDYGVTALTLSPDENVLVVGTGYEDSSIRVLNAETGKLLAKLEGHTGWIGELVFSPDGRLLASASADQSIRLWDASDWKELSVFRGHGDEVHGVAFSPDGLMLASGGKDGAIMLWAVSPRTSAQGHRVLPSALHRAGEAAPGIALAVDLRENRSTLLRFEDFAQSPLRLPAWLGSGTNQIFVLPNIFGVYDQTNTLWFYEVRSDTPSLLGKLIVGEISAGGAKLRPGAMAYCQQKRLAAWRDGAGAVHIANLDDPGRRLRLNSELDEPTPTRFSPDGNWLVLVGRQGRDLEIFEAASGKLVSKLENQLVRELLLFANHGRTLALVVHLDTSGGSVVFCDLTLPEREPVRFTERGTLVGLAAAPDGRLVAVASEDGLVFIYDSQTMEPKIVLHGHMQGVHGVQFSPDGKNLASSSGGREAIKLWHVETGQELLTLNGMGSLLNQVEFMDNGNVLLAGGRGQTGTWQIWRAPSWEQIAATEAKQEVKLKQR